MDIQQFDVLEKKITQLVAAISQLKSENGELRHRIREMEALQQRTEEQLRNSQEMLEKLKGSQGESMAYKEREEKIKSKIEHMLAKLEELQMQF